MIPGRPVGLPTEERRPMSDIQPELVSVEGVTTAVVRGQVRVDRLPDFFDASFTDLARTTAEQGIAILGPAYALYRGPFEDTVDLEVGFPVDRPVRAAGEVAPGRLPGGRVARVTHSGGYDGLGDAWAGLAAWLSAQGLAPSAERWEVYVTQPSPEMDPADLRTELVWPVG
jgi:effector-binding domain-containing protein